jgi:hypothetical protein
MITVKIASGKIASGATEAPLVVQLQVYGRPASSAADGLRDGEPLYSRELRIARTDCPQLPHLLQVIVARWLARLPVVAVPPDQRLTLNVLARARPELLAAGVAGAFGFGMTYGAHHQIIATLTGRVTSARNLGAGRFLVTGAMFSAGYRYGGWLRFDSAWENLRYGYPMPGGWAPYAELRAGPLVLIGLDHANNQQTVVCGLEAAVGLERRWGLLLFGIGFSASLLRHRAVSEPTPTTRASREIGLIGWELTLGWAFFEQIR